MGKNKKCGALWEKSYAGDTYFSGVLEFQDGDKIDIVVRKNKYKKTEKQPDYVIFQRVGKKQEYEFWTITIKN